jgi:hypothetical protein
MLVSVSEMLLFQHHHSDLELSGLLPSFSAQEPEDGRGDQNNGVGREVPFFGIAVLSAGRSSLCSNLLILWKRKFLT